MNSQESTRAEVLNLLECAPKLDDFDLVPATSLQIRDFELETSIKLPTEIRELMDLCNGALVKPGGICSLSEMVSAYSYFPKWMGKGWLPVATDGCGDYYVLDTREIIQTSSTHPIYFVDQIDYDRGNYIVASGLWEFLRFLLEDEILSNENPIDPSTAEWDDSLKTWTNTNSKVYWPFNKNKVLEFDPDLAFYKGKVPFAWDLD
ncbi:MAG: SMI1/KNR4 family protein [Verrucomicrobiota bacterium]